MLELVKAALTCMNTAGYAVMCSAVNTNRPAEFDLAMTAITKKAVSFLHWSVTYWYMYCVCMYILLITKATTHTIYVYPFCCYAVSSALIRSDMCGVGHHPIPFMFFPGTSYEKRIFNAAI